jgi:PAS domain S-box-containing protein
MKNKDLFSVRPELIESIIEGMGDGISIQDTNFKVLYQNRIHKGFVGEHIGEYCYKAYEKRENVCDGCPVIMSFEDNKVHTAERVVTINDNLTYFEITSSTLKDSDGNIIAAIENVRDVTERREKEEKLLENEEKFRLLYENLPLGYQSLDLQGNLIIVNQAWLDLLGYSSKEEVIGRSILDFVTEDELIAERFPKFKASGSIHELLFELRRKDGTTILVSVDGRVSYDKDGKFIQTHCVLHDVTEKQKAEQERELLNAELARKNKELEQVVYVTSHDLRTPLVNIEGYSKEIGRLLEKLRLLLGGHGTSAEVKEKIDVIVEKDIPQAEHYITTSVSKMDALLAGLLHISRLGRIEIKKEKLVMNKIVSDVLNALQYKVEKSGIKIEMSELPSCIGDKNQINQLFSNLIDNAIKYLDFSRSGVINVSGKTEGDYSVYCVEDNGIGISPEHNEKIFEIFYQLKPKISAGEGLGLTIVKKIIDMHSGHIWLESELGKGSKFFVSIPS